MITWIKKFFKIEERNTSIRTEVLAGLTTFLAMAYILPVNSGMLSGAGVPFGGVFFATAVASAMACLIMGLVANYPVALAPGMGINAFFTYNVVLFGFPGVEWRGALAAVFISGILFLIVSVTGIRRAVINAVPQGLKFAVGAGIGFFITFIGLKNMGLVVSSPATLVQLGNIAHPAVLLGIFGLVLVIILYSMGNKFSLIIAITATAVIGLLLGAFGVSTMPTFSTDFSVGFFGEVGETLFAPFRGGFQELFSHPSAWFIIFIFLFVDFFDTAGTLMAVGNQAGLINEDSELVGGDRALLADAIGTIGGSMIGTSTVTSYIESSTGIEQGGRTGLTAVTVGLLFLISLLIYPLLSVVTGVFDPVTGIVYSPVTAMALVMVGALMVTQLKNIDWGDKAILIPAFLTIVFMIFTFSIAEGIAIGFIFYPIIMIFTKRAKEVNPIMYALMVVFILFFALQTIM